MLIASKNENKTHFWQVTGVMGGKFFVIIYIELYDNIFIYVTRTTRATPTSPSYVTSTGSGMPSGPGYATSASSAMPSVLTHSAENFPCY